jgi:malate dehydrogenase
MSDHKVSIIGAGNVGAECAQQMAARGLADIVLIDINEGLAKGKALDLTEAGLMMGSGVEVNGGSDYSMIEGSDIVVITAGVPRRKDPETGKFPSRDELVKTNQRIVGGVSHNIAKHAPDSIIIIVSNPLDAMCHVVLQESGFDSSRVIGQAGALDAARYKTFIAQELDVNVHNVHGLILGGHGDQMVPLTRHTSVAGIPIQELMSEEKLDEIVQRTRKGGGEIVNLMGYSAYYAPAAGTVQMVTSIMQNELRVIACSVYLTGQYGYDGLFMGVPIVLGIDGVQRILEMKLKPDEKAMLDKSAEAVRNVVKILGN